jgi:hypothetical protein
MGGHEEEADEKRADERDKSPHDEADTRDRDQRQDAGGEDVVPHTVDEQDAEPADKIPPADPIHHVANRQGRVARLGSRVQRVRLLQERLRHALRTRDQAFSPPVVRERGKHGGADDLSRFPIRQKAFDPVAGLDFPHDPIGLR